MVDRDYWLHVDVGASTASSINEMTEWLNITESLTNSYPPSIWANG